MSFLKDSFKSLNAFLPELITLRRILHANPELSGQEYKTRRLIVDQLTNYGWRIKQSQECMGVIAELGPIDGPLIGLRVDMDALPIKELTGLDHASQIEGVMHACGHDIHTCIGLGIAKLFTTELTPLTGIRLIFQPAEEIAKGAKWMRDEGATQNLNVLFGVHVAPELPVGSIGLRSGTLTAGAGELEIEIIGIGGHGARPHESVDSIWITAKVITTLQEAISRCLDSLNPVVISFGKIEGGNAFNVIPDRVRLLGTVRCLDESLHKQLPSWIEKIVKSITSGFGADAIIHYRRIAPPVKNDSELTDLLENSAVSLLGKERVVRLQNPSLGAEDFAELLEKVKGTMFRLGVAGNEGCAPLHNGLFSPDENSIEIGVKVLAQTILSWMKMQTNIK